MKKIIYSIVALTFILVSCNNSASDAEHDHDAHEHGTHEHDNGEVHEDHGHDHHQEEFTVEDSLTK
jgi:Ni/Co efflux regulator RcnB